MLDGFGRQLHGSDEAHPLQGMLEFIKQSIWSSPRIITDVNAPGRGERQMNSRNQTASARDATRLLAGEPRDIAEFARDYARAFVS